MPRAGAAGAAAAAAAAALLSAAPAAAFLPSQNPPWPASYEMTQSTLTMACNSSGWYNVTWGGAFGITSYDVSVRSRRPAGVYAPGGVYGRPSTRPRAYSHTRGCADARH